MTWNTTPISGPQCSVQTPYTASDMWVPITYVAVLLTFSVVGNSLVLFIYSCRWQSKGATKVYVCTLAILDLLAALIMMPHHLLTFAFVSPLKMMDFDLDVFCKFNSFLGYTLYSTNAFVLVAIALSRYFKVSKIVRAVKEDRSKGRVIRTICSKLSRVVTSNLGAKVTSLVAFLLAVVMTLPAVGLQKNVPNQDCLFWKPPNNSLDFSCYLACEFNRTSADDRDLAKGFLGVKVAAFVCTCFVMFSLYGLIYCRVKVLEKSELELKRQNRRSVDLARKPSTPAGDGKVEYFPQLSYSLASSSQPARDLVHQPEANDGDIPLGLSTDAAMQDAKTSRRSRNVTLMLLIVTLVFTLSYLPFFVLTFAELMANEDQWCDMSTDKLIAFEVFSHSFLISNAVNPLVYGFCDPTFRRVLWKTLKWRRDII